MKKLWNMQVTIIPIVIGAFGTVTKGLLKWLEDLEVGGRVETIQTTALLRTARILRGVLETCCHSDSNEKPSANADVKSSNEWIIIIIIIIEKTMQTWRVELTAGGKSLAEVKIQRGIFQEDALSPLLFVKAMMPLNLRKCTVGYKLSKSQEKINHLKYMDNIKLFAQNEKELETLIQSVRIYSQDIGMEFCSEKVCIII